MTATMVIERIDRPHWRSEKKAQVLEPGYEELIYDSFGTKKVLAVNSPDSVTVTKIIDGMVFPRTYEREKIVDIYWFRGLAALNLLIGKDVKFAWRPSEEQSQ